MRLIAFGASPKRSLFPFSASRERHVIYHCRIAERGRIYWLTPLPPEICSLTSLRTLNLSFNSLTTLPPEIGKLTNLSHLNLWDNKLTTLPVEIEELTNLTELWHGNNPLE